MNAPTPDNMSADDRDRIDVAALQRYLQAQVQGFRGPLAVQRFKGGQSNPTFLLSTDEKRYVLRKKPGGPLLPSAHAVEREYRVIAALQGSEVPVAPSPDISRIGYWMDFRAVPVSF
jgi:aminoglycoside phosphotransferase (APT) family kinase protein